MYIPEKLLQTIHTTGSYSLKYRDPVQNDSDYVVILDDWAELMR